MLQVYPSEFGPQEVEKVPTSEMCKEEKDAHMKKIKLQRDHNSWAFRRRCSKQ